MKTYQVTLPDEFAEMADNLLAHAGYESFDYMVMAALLALRDQVRWEDGLDSERLRGEVREGLASADEGKSSPLDMAAIWQRVQERLTADRGATHAGRNEERVGRG